MLELGLIGFFVLCCLLAVLLVRLYRGWRSETNPYARRLRFGIMASLSIGLVNAFEEPSFWAPQYTVIFWFLMGIGCIGSWGTELTEKTYD